MDGTRRVVESADALAEGGYCRVGFERGTDPSPHYASGPKNGIESGNSAHIQSQNPITLPITSASSPQLSLPLATHSQLFVSRA